MRYIIALLLGILLVTPACSSEKESKPESSKPSSEQAFLDELHREFPGQALLTDEELIKIPTSFCDDLDNGFTINQVFLAIGIYAEGAQEKKIWAEATSEGIVTFCPEHADALMEVASHQ